MRRAPPHDIVSKRLSRRTGISNVLELFGGAKGIDITRTLATDSIHGKRN